MNTDFSTLDEARPSSSSGAFDYLGLIMFSERPQAASQLIRTQHAELLSDLEQIVALTDGGSGESLSIRNAMTRFSGRVMLHLQLERGVVGKQMDADPRSRALADQFERDLVPVRGALSDWLKRFPAASTIASDLDAFRHETEKLVGVFSERFRHEERDLLPEYDRVVNGVR